MPSPPWVSQSLADILGLDDETINAAIVPDLESYNSQVRLRGHLQDFLGSTPAARAFADRYVAYRFPPPPSAPAPAPRSKPASKPASKPVSPRKKPGSLPAPQPEALSSAISAAFGPGGHIHQKRRDDDLFPSRPSSSRGAPRSGAHTPLRAPGAVTFQEAKVKERPAPPKPKEDKIWDLPKSKETLRLEGVASALRKVQAGDKVVAEETVCFCQARLHGIAKYTPACTACGLVLCELHPPHAPCPSCARPTLPPPALARLILRIENDIVAQLAHEADERDAAEREKRERLLSASGGGAFPSLPGGHASRPTSAADAARRVLTIKAKGKGKGKGKALLTTTTYSVVDKTPQPVEEDKLETVARPRSPPIEPSRAARELAKALAWRVENDRPWGDPKIERRGESWAYVEDVMPVLAAEDGVGRRRKAKEKKRVGLDGRAVVGAA